MGRKQIRAQPEQRLHFVAPIIKTARLIFGILAILQFTTVVILWIVAALRRRPDRERSFPIIDLKEVQVGENSLQLYCYGQALFDAMLDAIDGARETIYLESFIWKSDEVGQAFKDHLACKAAAGVQVYVIFDSFGNLVVPRAFKSSFHPNIHVLEYQFMRRPWHVFDPRRYALDHRKILAVDGRVGFIGGYNIGSLYATSWRDTHLRICGPAAADLAQSFADFWNRACLKGEQITRRYERQFDPLITLWGNDALRLTFPIRDMYIENIDRAEHSIWLTNAYFVPDHILLNELKAAAGRGVDVRILVPWNSNHIIVDWVSRGYFSECLRAGIRIFGYRHTMLHAKTCTIDGQWTTVGTANLDRLSSIGNFEINIEVYSPELAQQMQALFESDIADMFELTLENWHSRPLLTKLSERILAPLRFIL
ncbi:MAG: phosphatidylserine/phosphatidylglycerophosphate/cardiolipin synthase family protein [Ktedonobacteraceae bacterium]|nr:phosphatidylserine/phosphatidylglycerophosphate/cardiolipin synthase family protein [Ktedonobacteraceae bacterium]